MKIKKYYNIKIKDLNSSWNNPIITFIPKHENGQDWWNIQLKVALSPISSEENEELTKKKSYLFIKEFSDSAMNVYQSNKLSFLRHLLYEIITKEIKKTYLNIEKNVNQKALGESFDIKEWTRWSESLEFENYIEQKYNIILNYDNVNMIEQQLIALRSI